MKFTYLLVEGPHDAAFLGKILKLGGLGQIRKYDQLNSYWKPLIPTTFPHKGDLLTRVPVPAFFQSPDFSVAIHVAVGDSAIPNALQESLSVLPVASLDAVGIFLDSDSELPSVRFGKLKAAVSVHIPNWPSQPGTILRAAPRTGIFVLPDNSSTGTLEDLLLESAITAWPEALGLAKSFVVNAGAKLSDADSRELRKSAGVNKATVACISNLLRPGKAIQVSIDDNDWFARNSARQQTLMSFVYQLVDFVTDLPPDN